VGDAAPTRIVFAVMHRPEPFRSPQPPDMARWAGAKPAGPCPVDHGTGWRSQIRIEATSTVPRQTKSRLSYLVAQRCARGAGRRPARRCCAAYRRQRRRRVASRPCCHAGAGCGPGPRVWDSGPDPAAAYVSTDRALGVCAPGQGRHARRAADGGHGFARNTHLDEVPERTGRQAVPSAAAIPDISPSGGRADEATRTISTPGPAAGRGEPA